MQRTRQLPLVIFRPGIVIGKGGNPFHWGVGRLNQNICEVWGDGRNQLPFVLASDVAAALVRGIQVPGIDGRAFNLIDYPLISARDYLDELQRQSGVRVSAIYRPIWQFYLSDLVKWVVKMLAPDIMTGSESRAMRIGRSRTQKGIFDCSRARTELGWQPASAASVSSRKESATRWSRGWRQSSERQPVVHLTKGRICSNSTRTIGNNRKEQIHLRTCDFGCTRLL